jgi:hypothetical protein
MLFGPNGLMFSERGLVYSNPGAPCPECCGSGSGSGGGVCPCCRGDSPASVLLTFTGLSYATCGTAACIPNPDAGGGFCFHDGTLPPTLWATVTGSLGSYCVPLSFCTGAISVNDLVIKIYCDSGCTIPAFAQSGPATINVSLLGSPLTADPCYWAVNATINVITPGDPSSVLYHWSLFCGQETPVAGTLDCTRQIILGNDPTVCGFFPACSAIASGGSAVLTPRLSGC